MTFFKMILVFSPLNLFEETHYGQNSCFEQKRSLVSWIVLLSSKHCCCPGESGLQNPFVLCFCAVKIVLISCGIFSLSWERLEPPSLNKTVDKVWINWVLSVTFLWALIWDCTKSHDLTWAMELILFCYSRLFWEEFNKCYLQ